MSVTERLASLPIPYVLGIIAVLVVVRFLLIKQEQPIAKSIAEIAESLAIAMALVYLLIRPFIIQAFFIPSESMVPTLHVHDHIMVNKFIYRFTEPKLGDVVVFQAPKAADPSYPGRRDFIKRIIGTPGDCVRVEEGYVRVGDEQFSNRKMLRQALRPYAPRGNVPLEDMFLVFTKDGVKFGTRTIKSSELAEALTGDPEADVEVVPGKVYVNGKVIKEPYIAEDPWFPYPITNDFLDANIDDSQRDQISATDSKYVVEGEDDKLCVKVPENKYLVMGDNRNHSNDGRFWGFVDRKDFHGKAMFIFWPLSRIQWVH